MGWGDIDFNKIVTGAITRGPAGVSFAEYLNTFALALDERLQVLIVATSPTLPEITFQANEIRNEKFWTKYRDLLSGYFDIWNDYQWYTPGVLSDVVNDSDYIITEADLRAQIGDTVFETLRDAQTLPWSKLFTAEVLNGLYDLYGYLTINKKSLQRYNDTASIRLNAFYVLRDQLTLNALGIGSDPTPSGTYSGAVSDYNANKTVSNPTLGGNLRLYFVTQNDNDRTTSGSSNGWSVRVNYNQNREFWVKARDLNNNVINLDYSVGKVLVLDNRLEETLAGVPSPTVQYNTDYPLVEASDPDVNASPVVVDTSTDLTKGNGKFFYEGTGGLAEIPLTSAVGGSGDGTFIKTVEFQINLPTEAFIDVNNSSLEFYIP